MYRIIFIEGVSGVGKTTSSAVLHKELRSKGYLYECFLEGDRGNPLDPFNGTYPPKISLTEYQHFYKEKWRQFVKNILPQAAGLILDGTLLHHQINDLIKIYNEPDENILNYLTDLMKIIRSLDPIVFYLESRDVAQRLTQARMSRGQTPPEAEQIMYWQKRKLTDLLMLEKLCDKSHIINIDSGFDTLVNEMLGYLF